MKHTGINVKLGTAYVKARHGSASLSKALPRSAASQQPTSCGPMFASSTPWATRVRMGSGNE